MFDIKPVSNRTVGKKSNIDQASIDVAVGIERDRRSNLADSEIAAGQRFAFGKNWSKFLKGLSESRISHAEQSLQERLGIERLDGNKFLDVGSGSGLFSLAARRLGASVHSIDYDPLSVACTSELRRRYSPNDANWVIECGSALDSGYINSLGEWDVVYSWGVLHHTGDMWQALENVARPVRKHGKFFIAIYNDQGRGSRRWLWVKRAYNKFPESFRWAVLLPALLRLWGPTTLRDLFRGRPFETWRHYEEKSLRGMSPWYDVVDWVGGLPFEVAKPEAIFDFFRKRGFTLVRLSTRGGGVGCNEFVFERLA